MNKFKVGDSVTMMVSGVIEELPEDGYDIYTVRYFGNIGDPYGYILGGEDEIESTEVP